MLKSKLPNNVLAKIWTLSEIDKDGMLDADEFALVMHLVGIKIDGQDLPEELPEYLVPPSKRSFKTKIEETAFWFRHFATISCHFIANYMYLTTLLNIFNKTYGNFQERKKEKKCFFLNPNLSLKRLSVP